MSAVFEVELLYKKLVSIFKILEGMKCAKITYNIDTVETIDSWEWENHQKIHRWEESLIEESVSMGKIVLLGGVIKEKYKFGMNFSKLKEHKFQIGFWISTEHLPQLDSSWVNAENKEIYDKLIEEMTRQLEKEQWIACSMGTELVVEEEKKLEDMIEDSHNVCVWILPEKNSAVVLKEYEGKRLNTYQIYERRKQTL